MPPADPDPVLSVVIPTHDVEPWVRETLESVLAQDLPLEVIVVDDHSTDGTCDIVRSFVDAGAPVSLVTASVRGGGPARNAGAARATGRYLVFCDGDDLVPRGAYAALVASLTASGSDIAIGDYLKFRPVDTWRPTDPMPAFDRLRDGDGATGIRLVDEPTLLYSRPCWNRVFLRSFWAEGGFAFPDVIRSNDIVPVVASLVAADRVDLVPSCVYVYRERPGASSMSARATGADSLISYLGQEAECGRLVAGIPSVAAAHAELVWARDGYVAVARFLAGRGVGEADGDAAVVSALAELLALTSGAPAALAPYRRLVLSLAAAGELDAARAFVVDEFDAPMDARDRSIAWAAALEAALGSGPIAATDLDAFAPQIAAALGGADADPDAWRRLLTAAGAAAGDALGPLVPGLDRDADEASGLRAVPASLEAVDGGRTLTLRGTLAGDDDPDLALPVLFFRGAAISPYATGRRPVAGGWRWAARFAASDLPVGEPLVPMLVRGHCRVALMGHPKLPEYSARDPFLYERMGDAVVIRKRHHWLLRAVRRAAIVAVGRVRGSRG